MKTNLRVGNRGREAGLVKWIGRAVLGMLKAGLWRDSQQETQHGRWGGRITNMKVEIETRGEEPAQLRG